MRRTRIAALATAAVVAVGAGGLLTTSLAAAHAAGRAALPTHVFAPYFEAWTGESPATLSKQSGSKYLTMAFIQTPSVGSCTAYWNGNTGQPIAQRTFGAAITQIRARGGDVIPSFGGFTADTDGTELADSCTNVNAIARQFEKLITTYGITRIDLDVEVESLTRTAGIDRRNKAIKKVEDWAAAHGRIIQFSYTLPTSTHGLENDALAVLQNAVSNKARIDIVNLMTFDYYDNKPHQMANDTKTAATGLVNQLRTLYPNKTNTRLWGMVGVTEMIGIDDFGAAETFTTADATVVEKWAARRGIALLSFWAVQRDNGTCPGGDAADNCSGVSQSPWQFAHAFQPFTSSGNPRPSPSVSPTGRPKPSPSTSPPPSGNAWAAWTPYAVGQVVTYDGVTYTCRQAHISLPGWEPPNVPALWLAS